MRRQTVVAGCIAGVVGACGGVAVDATGRTMIDAGDSLAGMGGALVAGTGGRAGAGTGGVVAGAGGLVASAGTTLAQAGRALLGGRGGRGGTGGGGLGGTPSGVAGTGSVAAQEPSGDGLPRPHWVLRDADGTPVQADVQPGVAPGNRIRFASATTSVYVAYAGSRRIELCYRLDAGTLALSSECVFSPVTAAADWHSAAGAYYLDAACNQPAASSTSSVAQVAGQYYYPGEDPVSPTTHYTWDQAKSACVAHPASTLQLWGYKAVPTDIVHLLPHPPYSLELAY